MWIGVYFNVQESRIEQLIPGAKLDVKSFDPYGFSVNAIIKVLHLYSVCTLAFSFCSICNMWGISMLYSMLDMYQVNAIYITYGLLYMYSSVGCWNPRYN